LNIIIANVYVKNNIVTSHPDMYPDGVGKWGVAYVIYMSVTGVLQVAEEL